MNKIVAVDVTQKTKIFLFVPENFKKSDLTEEIVNEAIKKTVNGNNLDSEIKSGHLKTAKFQDIDYFQMLYDVESKKAIWKSNMETKYGNKIWRQNVVHD